MSDFYTNFQEYYDDNIDDLIDADPDDIMERVWNARELQVVRLKQEIRSLISVIENSEEEQDSGIAWRYITNNEEYLKRLVR